MFAIRAGWAFDGVSVLPGGATVLVDGEHLAGVEPGTAPVPDGVEVLDFPEGTVLPGLINTHVHLCGDSGVDALDRLPDFSDEHLDSVIDVALDQQLAAGVTTVRDLGDRRWAVLERRGRNAGRPHILASGPPITCPGGHCWSMGGEASGVDAMRQAVRERVERQADVVKVMASGGNMTPNTDVTACQFTLEELRAAVDEAHRLGLALTAHAHGLAAVEQVIAAGVDGIEHCTCVTATGVEISDELLGRLAARRIAVCPTLGILPGAVPPPRVAEMLARSGLTLERRRQMMGQAHAAGVRMVSGDDSGISLGKPHGVFAEALIDLELGGVSPPDALATATSEAADVCGVGSRKGRLVPGFDADVLVVNGDATSDTTALRSIAAVALRGDLVLDRSG